MKKCNKETKPCIKDSEICVSKEKRNTTTYQGGLNCKAIVSNLPNGMNSKRRERKMEKETQIIPFREVGRFTKSVEETFTPWRFLEFAERAACLCGIYELGIVCQKVPEKKPLCILPQNVIPMYVGVSVNLCDRMLQYKHSGSHLCEEFELAQSQGCEIVYRTRHLLSCYGVKALIDIFTDTSTINICEAYMDESRFLGTFNYAWNSIGNGGHTKRTIHQVLNNIQSATSVSYKSLQPLQHRNRSKICLKVKNSFAHRSRSKAYCVSCLPRGHVIPTKKFVLQEFRQNPDPWLHFCNCKFHTSLVTLRDTQQVTAVLSRDNIFNYLCVEANLRPYTICNATPKQYRSAYSTKRGIDSILPSNISSASHSCLFQNKNTLANNNFTKITNFSKDLHFPQKKPKK